MSSRTSPSPDPSGEAGPAAAPTLAREFRRPQAIALYVSSVLGTGILVLPGITAQIAGPASLIAWALLALASVPFALTFASLSARHPESGGVYAFVREAFGAQAATVTAWLFLLWVGAGAPAVALIAASYLAFAFGVARPVAYLLGFALVAVPVGINYRGIRFSNRVQLAVIVSIVALLVVTVLLASPRVSAGNFHPFLPDGIASIGVAAALIFWSFLGYENTSNVAEEFEDPVRDLPPSVYASVAIVGALYLLVAWVTVGTGAYRAGGGVAPFAAVLSLVVGPYGAAATALLAAFIVFCVVNAYTTGMSRVIYAAAKDGCFPRTLAHLHPRYQVPDHALVLMLAVTGSVVGLYYVLDVSLAQALLVASGAAITVYVLGSAAGVRLFQHAVVRTRGRVGLAAVSLGISLVVLPFVGLYLGVTGGVVAGALLWSRSRGARSLPS